MNFLSVRPKGPHEQAESKFVRINCSDQVDFCPFRGPDAPFCAALILYWLLQKVQNRVIFKQILTKGRPNCWTSKIKR
jgi:hypothetical protein